MALVLALLGAPDIPYDAIDERYRESVRRVVESRTLEVPIPAETVRSTPELYEFLLEQLPFTASLVRALGEGSYDIWTAESVATEPAADEAEEEWRRRTCYVDDGDGLVLRAVLVHHSENHWVYYTYGYYHAAPLPRIPGWSVIQMWCAPGEEGLHTEAVVHVRLSGITEAVAEAMPDVVRGMVQEKSGVFVRAARTVTEVAHSDPERLLRQGRASPEVDPTVLDLFRRRFLE